MGDFAKIIRATDGAQVLFYKGEDAEGRPALNQVTEFDGIMGRLDLGFGNGEWDKLDTAFDKADQETADAVRTAFRKFISEQPGEEGRNG